MTDLISRADAIEAVGKLLVDGQIAKVDGKFVPLHFALMNTLSALPSAEAVSREEYERLEALYDAVRIYDSSDDAVEVVRCKDCKYRYMDGEVTHYYWCRLHDRPVDDTDYCAWGEESEVEE